MNIEDIVSIQERIGTVADGFWGPKSIAAAKIYLHRMNAHSRQWPGTSQAELQKFYGSHGDESMLVSIQAPKGLLYEGGQCSTVRCHKKVADSLSRILDRLANEAPEIAAQYAGCYNNRKMRGGSLPSMHARGAAVDFAPDDNGNLVHWPAVATMPWKVIEIFAAEGWKSAAVHWGRDAMHFEASS